MQAAWFAFLHAGRREHPRLRVLFAMLAGGAPLQLERFEARSGAASSPPDPLVFYDTSSYGPRMLRAMVDAVGLDQLVYGSDRPVIDAHRPRSGAAQEQALLSTNPRRLLGSGPKGDSA
jgi:predicted TIM-barrel fold metal-dependent hydrolase